MMPIEDYINGRAFKKPSALSPCHGNHGIHGFSIVFQLEHRKREAVNIYNNRKNPVNLVTPVTGGPGSRSFGASPKPEKDLRLTGAYRLFTPLAQCPTEAGTPFHTLLANIAPAFQEVVGSGGIAYGFTNPLKLKRISAGRMDYKSIVQQQPKLFNCSWPPMQIRSCNALSAPIPGTVRARP